VTAKSPLRILLLEDDADDAELVREYLEANDIVCAITRVQTRADFVAALEVNETDLILADYKLPAFDGFSALSLAQSVRSELPFIIVSGTLGEELAIEALQMGATDYVLKARLPRLVSAVRRALREAEQKAERKRSEETLRAQANLLNLTHDAIFVHDMNGIITYWNRGAELLYGWTAEEARGQIARELLQTVIPMPFELKDGRWRGELVRITKDGAQVIVASRWSLQRDDKGTAVAILETNNDITERKRAETLTATVFERAPDAMSIIGRDYRHRRVNPVYERNLRMPAERIVGKHISELLGAEVFEQTVKPNLDRCFAGEEVTFAEWFTYPRGRLYLAITYSPLRLESERVEAALAVGRDITEHMLASEALRAAQAELAHVNRVTTMGQMTASIAHEVGQPISAVITNANAALRWLSTQPADLEEVRQALGRIVKDGHRAGEVLGRIRALVKKVPPRRDCSDVNEAVREIIALIQAECHRNGVRVQTRLSGDLPPVVGDRVQVQQVILNLIVNAIEAMSEGSNGPSELTIVSDVGDSNHVLVEVQDTGPGFEMGELDRLFRPFYTTKPDGLGMGLAICRSIVEAHRGRLWAEPNRPRGAVFRFTLPIGAIR
jgi:PAS domain S-box-containing protein